MSEMAVRLKELAESPRMALDRGVLRWAADELERLRAERDEARRHLAAVFPLAERGWETAQESVKPEYLPRIRTAYAYLEAASPPAAPAPLAAEERERLGRSLMAAVGFSDGCWDDLPEGRKEFFRSSAEAVAARAGRISSPVPAAIVQVPADGEYQPSWHAFADLDAAMRFVREADRDGQLIRIGAWVWHGGET